MFGVLFEFIDCLARFIRRPLQIGVGGVDLPTGSAGCQRFGAFAQFPVTLYDERARAFEEKQLDVENQRGIGPLVLVRFSL